MRIIGVIVLLFVLCILNLVAQSTVQYFGQVNKQLLFIDDFSTEKYAWKKISKNAGNYFQIKDNKLILNALYDELLVAESKQFDANADWEIEVCLKRETHESDEYGLLWGGTDNFEKTYAFILNSRNFYVKKGKNSLVNRNNTETNKINKSGWNTITIRKVHNRLFFFINFKNVFSMPYKPWFGSNFSLYAGKGAKVLVENLTISYLIATEFPMPDSIQFSKIKSSKAYGSNAYVKFEVSSNCGIAEILHNNKAIKFETANQVSVSLSVNLLNEITPVKIRVTNGLGKDIDSTILLNSNGELIQENLVNKRKSAKEIRKIALIVGNSNYKHIMPLINPRNDAILITNTLQKCGFETITRFNMDSALFENLLSQFIPKLVSYDVALFYFAGHGININKVNYLMLTDCKINFEKQRISNAIVLDSVILSLSKSVNQSIFIFDACRDNPFEGGVQSVGFVRTDPPKGAIVAFAATEGQLADDGIKNGLYTEELAKQMLIHQAIEDVFKNTRMELLKKGRQNPIEMSNFIGNFYFRTQSEK